MGDSWDRVNVADSHFLAMKRERALADRVKRAADKGERKRARRALCAARRERVSIWGGR